MNKPSNQAMEWYTRYSRQVLFAPVGPQGQRRLAQACVAVVGCGALGSGVIPSLTRAGVGRLLVIDRDYVEWSDLQRQMLFEESDAEQSLPKAEVSAQKARRMNSQVEIKGIIAHLDFKNAADLLSDADLIVDGTDNFETRFLINDLSVKLDKPWIYGGCVGSLGTSFTVIPGKTACLRCAYPEPPPPEETKTCDTAGVLQPAAAMVSAWQAAQVIKLLSDRSRDEGFRQMTFDVWSGDVRFFRTKRDDACPCCGRACFDFLEGRRASSTVSLCGRNAVQIMPERARDIDLPGLAARLSATFQVKANPYLLRLQAEGAELTLFKDGRVIVSGTTDAARARSLCSKYLAT